MIQRDPTITPADVAVRAGAGTQSMWEGTTLVDHPRFIQMGERVDAAHLFGLGYSVAWKSGKSKPYGIANQADSLIRFSTADEAVNKLKELIAAGIPVQVHMDAAFLQGFGGVHGSHFVVVHGYDASGVYYCDNGPPDGGYENVALKPCVVISTTGNFDDKGSLVVLKLKKGQTNITVNSNTLSVLRKKDDEDGIVHWRVEDQSAKKTKVVPSVVRTLILP